MDQYIGKMLDNRYEILECIGTGGMAMVYKARCHRLNRLVAVKILKPELAGDAEFRRRFHDESKAVAMLSHTNIVAVYDVSRSDDLDYIVMELIDGLTLKQYMKKRNAPLNWREALHFVTQIVRALGHAHSRGIIHRDIKPQNILVLRDGSVKVTDFGIARVASAAQATLTQEALGSVHYISPEQARGSHIDGRSDLYSAGVVLYEMLTGRLPFEGETPVSVAIQHINSIPIPPRDLNPSIPPALEAITLKAMAPKTENRYASADEMLADLEEFRKNPDVTPERAQQRGDEALMEEPTRVVPVSEIKHEEQRSRRAAGAEQQNDPPPAPVRQYRRRSTDRDERAGDYDDEPRRSLVPILVAVLAVLIFLGGMAFFIYNFIIKGMVSPEVKEIEVPDLTVHTWEELQRDPSLYDGFTLAPPEYRPDSDHEAGSILSQEPEGGTKVKEGSNVVIALVVSTKAEEEVLRVPVLTDKLSTIALNQLRDMGLVPEPRNEHNDTVDADYVIRTVPEANSPVKPGDTVTVYISLGKEKDTVLVPPFIGMELERLEEAVARAGLTLGEITKKISEEDVGLVTYQSIPAYESVERGTEIKFYVNVAPEEDPPEETTDPLASDSPDPQPDITEAIVVPGNKSITVDLSPYSGVEYVHIRVEVDRSPAFDSTVKTSGGSVQIPLSGMGRQMVEVYIDGLLSDIASGEIDFSAP